MSAHKVLLGYYQDLEIKDKLPISNFHSSFLKNIHDLTAPFFHYLKTDYTSIFNTVDDNFYPKRIEIKSNVIAKIGSKITKQLDFELIISNNRIETITLIKNSKKTIARCID